MNQNNKKNIIILATLIFFIIPIIIFIIYKITISTTNIQYLIAPSEVNISIDNSKSKIVKNKDINSINPGNHTIKVSKKDFETYTKNITVKKGQTIKFIVVLNRLTNKAKNEVKSVLTDETSESWAGQSFTEENNNITNNYPISNILPISNTWYKAILCNSQKYSNDSTKKAICISLYKSGADKVATQYIESNNYKLTDYEVIWENKY